MQVDVAVFVVDVAAQVDHSMPSQQVKQRKQQQLQWNEQQCTHLDLNLVYVDLVGVELVHVKVQSALMVEDPQEETKSE